MISDAVNITSALTVIGIAMHFKAQQIGDDRIWPNAAMPEVAIPSNPCQSLKPYLERQQGRAPAIDALIQLCITKSELNHHLLNKALDAAIPNAIALTAATINNVSPAQTAVSLRPQLAQVVQKNCRDLSKIRPRLCNAATQTQADVDVNNALGLLISSRDDRDSELGLLWAMNLGPRAKIIALELPNDTLRNQAAALMLTARSLSEENRSEVIAPHLNPSSPLNAIATLEGVRLRHPPIDDQIKGLIQDDPSSLAAALGRMTDANNDP